MMKKRKWIILCVLVVALHSFVLLKSDSAQQVAQEEKTEMTKEHESQDKIVSGPKDIKESTGIYVFVSWMWLAIVVLIYFLKLKIKEVDRLFEIRYLYGKKK
jgi:hypothetical protein